MEKLCISYIAASIVCLFYTFGKKGLVAVFLRSFPVFNSFRVLCKPYFLFVQLALLPLVFLCMKTKKYHDLLALGACLAVVNIMCSNGYAGGGTAISYISKSDDLDFDNYRIMTILEERAKADNPYYNEKLLLRNFPAFFGTYSVGAYNLSYTSEQYNLVNRLMNNETMWSEYAYQNVAFADNFVLV